MEHKPTIGLEVHAELKTETKMFCDSLNDPEEKHPNVNICPVCMGHPGTLPAPNKEAIKMVLCVGLALGGKIADYSRFDRKNYFYPDLPKGYQISQYQFPLVEGGKLNGVKITRVHLEEDTGRLVHEKDSTLVDFNRAGVPLMELVTEPVISSAEEARGFAQELRLLLRYLDVSDADMEKGHLRIEVNISLQLSNKLGLNHSEGMVGRTDFKKSVLGTKVEIKNLNSFKSVEQSINYEIKRQAEVLEKGGKIVQETRGWDEKKQRTFSQRGKEEAHEYRYFPEPDIPPLKLGEIEEFKNLEATIPELPWDKRERLKKEYALNDENAEMFINDKKFSDFFEEVVSEIRADEKRVSDKKIISLAVNYLTSDLAGLMKEKLLDFDELPVSPENFADLMDMVLEEKITSRSAKDILREMVETGGEPNILVEEKGLEQKNEDDFVGLAVQKVMKENPVAVDDYKKGKGTAVQFLLGMVMKETKGAANPKKARHILEKLLKG